VKPVLRVNRIFLRVFIHEFKRIHGWILNKKGEKSMTHTKEEFVEIVKKVRNVLKTDECVTCSCPNTRCEWHGDCYNCIRIYRHFGHNIPNCLKPVVNKKITRIKEAVEKEIQEIQKRSDEIYDYLYSVAPIE
jgi:hypothetical protein